MSGKNDCDFYSDCDFDCDCDVPLPFGDGGVFKLDCDYLEILEERTIKTWEDTPSFWWWWYSNWIAIIYRYSKNGLSKREKKL